MCFMVLYMKSILLVLSLVIALLALVSCVSTKEPTYKARAPETDDSNVPWNRPESGEGAGILGGILNKE